MQRSEPEFEFGFEHEPVVIAQGVLLQAVRECADQGFVVFVGVGTVRPGPIGGRRGSGGVKDGEEAAGARV